MDPLNITNYVDENGNKLVPPKIILQTSWNKRYPNKNYQDTDDKNSQPKQLLQVKDGDYNLTNVNLQNGQSGEPKRLVNGNKNNTTVKHDGNNNIEGIENLPFNGIQVLQYVYRHDIQRDHNYITNYITNGNNLFDFTFTINLNKSLKNASDPPSTVNLGDSLYIR